MPKMDQFRPPNWGKMAKIGLEFLKLGQSRPKMNQIRPPNWSKIVKIGRKSLIIGRNRPEMDQFGLKMAKKGQNRPKSLKMGQNRPNNRLREASRGVARLHFC